MNGTGEEEVGWVVAAQAGDLRAFDHLARRYRSALVALLASRLRRDEAEDAAQDALLIAFKALTDLEDPTRFRPWLAAIAKRRALRIIERRTDVSPLDDLIVAYAPGIVDRVERRLHAFELRAAIGRMDADHAIVARLALVDEWPIAEIADFVDAPVSTVKWRLHMARADLKRRFGDDYGL